MLPPEKCSLLGQINGAVSASAGSDAGGYLTATGRSYGEIRGQCLVNTLQNLAAASLNTARKTSPEAVYRRGSNGISTYSLAMEGLFLAEHENIRRIFSQGEWGQVYNLTCRPALNEYAETLEELNTHIQNNLLTDCFLGYELVDIVSTLSIRLGGKISELKDPFGRALKPIRETSKLSLRELLDDIRRRTMHLQTLPSDGAAVPITTETMTRLQNMPDFVQPLSTILVSLGDGNWSGARTSSDTASTRSASPKQFDVGADGHQLLAHYCIDTVETLLHNLESKARALMKHKTVLGAFIANNVAVIDRMIRTSELRLIMANSVTRLDSWRKKGASLYLDGWKDPSSFLLDVQYTNRGGQRPPSGSSTAVNSAEIIKSLGSKEKDALKDKFRGFNTSFEEMVSRHRALTMEREVRSQLAREVQAMIEPLYGRFWDRYHEIDKGKGKYVKYDKGQLAATLAALG